MWRVLRLVIVAALLVYVVSGLCDIVDQSRMFGTPKTVLVHHAQVQLQGGN